MRGIGDESKGTVSSGVCSSGELEPHSSPGVPSACAAPSARRPCWVARAGDAALHGADAHSLGTMMATVAPTAADSPSSTRMAAM